MIYGYSVCELRNSEQLKLYDLVYSLVHIELFLTYLNALASFKICQNERKWRGLEPGELQSTVYCISNKRSWLNPLVSAWYLITCVVIWHYHHKIYLQLLNIRYSFIFCLQKPSYPWLQILEALSVNLLPALNEGDDDEWCTVIEGMFFLFSLSRGAASVWAGCRLQRNHIFRVMPCFHLGTDITHINAHSRTNIHFYLKHDPFPSLSPFDFLHPFPPCTCQHTLDIRAM